MDPVNEHLPNHLVELFLAEATSADETRRVRQHSEGCAACASKLAQARAAQEAFLARNPPAARVAGLRQKASRPNRWPFLAVPAFAMAAAMALFVAPHLVPSTRPDALTKGKGSAFVVYRGGTTWPAKAAETLRAGDVLQPRLPSGGLNAVLVALSPTGVRTVAEVHSNGPKSLPSLTLDAAPEPLLLVLAWSYQPIDSEQVRRLGADALAKAGGDLAEVKTFAGDQTLKLDVATVLVLKER